jgi:hypothetical protein
MFLEYWMIGLFLIVSTYFMVKLYYSGYQQGSLDMSIQATDYILKILQGKKIISVVKTPDGDDKIIPGDIDAFIEETEKRKP